MQLSVEPQSWEQYSEKVLTAFSDPTTRVYIDTSFLMWLTKIGPKSFGELKSWLDAVSSGRVHVPIWACHEYANHHVADTLSQQLDETLGEMTGLASRAYRSLRPYLDADLQPGKPVAEEQMRLRATLSGLAAAAEACSLWKKAYKDRATQVMAFITQHALSKTSVFNLMNAYPALGIARFDGRLPPGFKDRGKKEKQSTGEGEVSGSNKYGDLVFWQEILCHAKLVGAKRILLMSKDIKNDWVFGGRSAPVDAELHQMQRNWKPLPIPHPTLSVEAREVAGVDELLMIDSVYLGALLRKQSIASVDSFIDVAVVPDPPTPTEQRKEVRRKALGESGVKPAASFLFPDGNRVEATTLALRLALPQCRSEPEPGSAIARLLEEANGLVREGSSISILFNEASFSSRTTSELAQFSRMLHERALSNHASGYNVAVVDLINALSRFPEKSAGAMMLGLLVAMYVPKPKECRLPATSPLLTQIYAASRSPFARTACEVIYNEVYANDMQPLFCPTGSDVILPAAFDIDHDNPDESSLTSVTVSGESLLNDLVFDRRLNLRHLRRGAEKMSGSEVLQLAAAIYGIPFETLAGGVDATRIFNVPDSLGFKDPASVYVERKERENV